MKLTCKTNFSNVNYNKENEVNLLIKTEAPLVEWQGERHPINIIAVIDTSTSMGTNNKINYAKKSLMKLIDNLAPQDKLGIIEFNTNVRMVAEAASMNQNNKDRFKTEVKQLRATACTNYHGALLTALKEAKNIKDDKVRVIFFTDGSPTTGITDKRTILAMHKAEMGSNTSVSAFGYGKVTDTGYGNDYDPQFLSAMSDQGKGNFAYIENPDDALTAFAKELGGLLSCYGQDLKFKIRLKDGMAKIKEILSDYDITEKPDHLVISINDIYSEESKNIVITLNLPKQPSNLPRDVNVLSVELEYLDTRSNKVKTVEASTKLKFVKEEDVDVKADQEVIDQVALCKLAKAQEEAEKHAQVGDFKTAGMVMMACSVHEASDAIQSDGALRSSFYSAPDAYSQSVGTRSALNIVRRGGRSHKGLDGNFETLNSSNATMDMMVQSFTNDDSTKIDLNDATKPSIATQIVNDPILGQRIPGTTDNGLKAPGQDINASLSDIAKALRADEKAKEEKEAKEEKGEKEEKKSLSRKRSIVEW